MPARFITKARRITKITKKVLYKTCFAIFVLFGASRYIVVAASAQTLTQRGFIEGVGSAFPQRASNDSTRLVGDLLAREEVFAKPAPWIQFAAGADLRANSHDQIDERWNVDFTDRGARRPRIAVRRLAATMTRGPVTVDVGKQFIRWGKADIVTPTDRFAPRDFLNVVDAEFLPVTGARAVAQVASETFEAVWVPRLTPSRIPLLDQRWTVVPSGPAAIPLVNVAQEFPSRGEAGLRWGHTGNGFEYSLSFFDGLNHLPNIETEVTLNAELARLAEKPCSACSAGSAFIALVAPIRRSGPPAPMPQSQAAGSRSKARRRTSRRRRQPQTNMSCMLCRSNGRLGSG